MHITRSFSETRPAVPVSDHPTDPSKATGNGKVLNGQAVSGVPEKTPKSRNFVQRLQGLPGKRELQKREAVNTLEASLNILKSEVGEGYHRFGYMLALDSLTTLIDKAKGGRSLDQAAVDRHMGVIQKARDSVIAERSKNNMASLKEVSMLKDDFDLKHTAAASGRDEKPVGPAVTDFCSVLNPGLANGTVIGAATRAVQYLNALQPAVVPVGNGGTPEAAGYQRRAPSTAERSGKNFTRFVEETHALIEVRSSHPMLLVCQPGPRRQWRYQPNRRRSW
ncbi:MAG: hypothetical protein EOO22_03175 [Comamonadaceae bacterium]|nr:MAG: hypothetical protein EOO22_03175 [Comamonadaceae bacterium]